jgi:acyl-CoA thioester hydrolase
VTVFRALTKVVCFQLSTGKPARMTDIFRSHYSVLPSVAAALAPAAHPPAHLTDN